jgi:hypothetical protein
MSPPPRRRTLASALGEHNRARKFRASIIIPPRGDHAPSKITE